MKAEISVTTDESAHDTREVESESTAQYEGDSDIRASITVGPWQIFSKHMPIFNSAEFDAAQAQIKIPLPEMIFGNSIMKIVNSQANWSIQFDALDALDLVDKTGNDIKVAHSEDWFRTRTGTTEDVRGAVKPYDWTYTTPYRGTVRGPQFQSTDDSLPMELLSRQDPIIFYDELVLFEDELADNGIATVMVKIRVMPARLLLLSRFFLRVDNVLFRIRDTRIYVEFSSGLVMRDYREFEAPYSQVRSKVMPWVSDFGALLRDSNWVIQHLQLVKQETENLIISI